jgi:predicted RNA-binding Zn-ribbon protein involved in translation (DUF1610 family)
MEFSIKDDPKFGVRVMKVAVLSSIPTWIGLLVAGFWFQSTAGALIVLAATLPFALAVIVRQTRFANCPDCGRRIQINWRQKGYMRGGMLQYQCPDCMTTWRTHLYPGSDLVAV